MTEYKGFGKRLKVIRADGEIITLEDGSKWQVSDLMDRPVEFDPGDIVIISRGAPVNPRICKINNLTQNRELTAVLVQP